MIPQIKKFVLKSSYAIQCHFDQTNITKIMQISTLGYLHRVFIYSLLIRIANGSLILLIFSVLNIGQVYCCNTDTNGQPPLFQPDSSLLMGRQSFNLKNTRANSFYNASYQEHECIRYAIYRLQWRIRGGSQGSMEPPFGLHLALKSTDDRL